ncbi:MAG: hypothetical protein K0S21_3482, partial [Rhizobiaceae bacterium]|nr:hypothetical protein [Rhizobiaceae bacterium]
MNAVPAGPVLAIASLGDAARPYPLRRAGFSRINDLERPGGHAVDGIGARRAAL